MEEIARLLPLLLGRLEAASSRVFAGAQWHVLEPLGSLILLLQSS